MKVEIFLNVPRASSKLSSHTKLYVFSKLACQPSFSILFMLNLKYTTWCIARIPTTEMGAGNNFWNLFTCSASKTAARNGACGGAGKESGSMRQALAHIARQANSLLQTYEESGNAQLDSVENLLTGSIRSFPAHGTSIASPSQGCSSRSTAPRATPPTNSRSIWSGEAVRQFRSLFFFYLSSFLTPLVFSLFLPTKNVILSGISAVEQM